MNSVHLLGRLTRDIELRYGQNQQAVGRFTLAVDRGKDKDGNDQDPDFIKCVAFGRTAEFIESRLGKGCLVAITGRIRTGKYDKDGKTIYTTDVIADRVDVCTWKKSDDSSEAAAPAAEDAAPAAKAPVDGFERLMDDDIPF